MKYDTQNFKLIKNEEIADGIFDWIVENPNLSKLAQPGQFAHVKVPGKTLRRPISICDATENTLRLVFQVKGEGTEIMSKIKTGEEVEILAPLGNGFKIEKGKKYCFIGGGIGVPPMLYAAKQAENPLVITGFRDKSLVILQEDFKKNGAEVVLTTDDGSAGVHGFVTDVLKERLSDIDEVCACGPIPMLKAISEICKGKVPCQISLEERMGCGIGACLVCACKTKLNGEEGYTHVCKNGPVYNAEEVVL
ncbi:MAG: dihydroorotate dehydrogenase electron transfer subunit [Oscillospiraceae bacterium]|nr:dihydroorotate dehydrogenase electron transfer subunit [Oscillospiraceae bacterium]